MLRQAEIELTLPKGEKLNQSMGPSSTVRSWVSSP